MKKALASMKFQADSPTEAIFLVSSIKILEVHYVKQQQLLLKSIK